MASQSQNKLLLMRAIEAYCARLPNLFCGFGKLYRQSVEAGSATIAVSSVHKKSYQSVYLTFLADVFKIGMAETLVDTDARKSIVSEELVWRRASFDILPSNANYKGVDSAVLMVEGVTSMTARFQGAVVDLGEVAVMKDLVYPVMLDKGWITQ